MLEERGTVGSIDVLSPNMVGWKDLLGYEGAFVHQVRRFAARRARSETRPALEA